MLALGLEQAYCRGVSAGSNWLPPGPAWLSPLYHQRLCSWIQVTEVAGDWEVKVCCNSLKCFGTRTIILASEKRLQISSPTSYKSLSSHHNLHRPCKQLVAFVAIHCIILLENFNPIVAATTPLCHTGGLHGNRRLQGGLLLLLLRGSHLSGAVSDRAEQ